MKSFLLIPLFAAGLAGLAAPAVAGEPYPGFTDRLFLACGDVGITTLFFGKDSRVMHYKHNNTASEAEINDCLNRKYAELLNNQFPNNHPGSAMKFTANPKKITISY